MDDPGIQSLRRSPFSGAGDLGSVFSQLDSISSVPMSATEDLGITPEMVAFIRQGIYNGDFRTPPPDTTANLDDVTNKLPGWSFVQDVGTKVTAKWVSDGSGGSVRFALAAGTYTSDSGYIEQITPVAGLIESSVVYSIRAVHDGSSAPLEPFLRTQYLDANGVATGTADFGLYSLVSPLVSTPNAEAGVPSDATHVRIRVGISQLTTSASDVDFDYIYMTDRLVIPGVILYPTISFNENDYAPTGRFHSQVWVITPSGATRDITGISAIDVAVGKVLWIYNFSSSNNLRLLHDDAGSSASNRIYTPNGVTVTILPRGGVMLMYFGESDGTAKRWRVLSEV